MKVDSITFPLFAPLTACVLPTVCVLSLWVMPQIGLPQARDTVGHEILSLSNSQSEFIEKLRAVIWGKQTDSLVVLARRLGLQPYNEATHATAELRQGINYSIPGSSYVTEGLIFSLPHTETSSAIEVEKLSFNNKTICITEETAISFGPGSKRSLGPGPAILSTDSPLPDEPHVRTWNEPDARRSISMEFMASGCAKAITITQDASAAD